MDSHVGVNRTTAVQSEDLVVADRTDAARGQNYNEKWQRQAHTSD
jgi:hypothetical protein